MQVHMGRRTANQAPEPTPGIDSRLRTFAHTT
jgi:hypothetical protein